MLSMDFDEVLLAPFSVREDVTSHESHGHGRRRVVLRGFIPLYPVGSTPRSLRVITPLRRKSRAQVEASGK